MAKKKILMPIDGSERSMKSLNFIKDVYSVDDVDITIINIKELVFVDGISVSDEIKNSEGIAREILRKAKEQIDEYNVDVSFEFGYAGDEIVRKAQEGDYDVIVMTKSSKKGLHKIIGSCTAYVVRNAPCTVVIVPEKSNK